MTGKDQQSNELVSGFVFDYDAVFNPEYYLYFYEDRLAEDKTDQEIKFLKEVLKLGLGMNILDLACGHGRHANKLSELGYSVLGIDINEDFLEIARDYTKQKGLAVQYIRQDMREISYSNEFDRILLLFTSFGYFNDAENLRVLKNISKALKSDGLFCLDLINRDYLSGNLKPCMITERQEDLMIDRISFDPKTGRTLNRRIYLKNGKRIDAPFSVRIYSYTEINELMRKVNLSIEEVYGGWNKESFSNQSYRMIIVASKKAEPLA